MISWLDGLSGPGPFYSRIPAFAGVEIKILCASPMNNIHGLFTASFAEDSTTKLPCLTNSPKIKWYVTVHYDYLTTGETTQFNESTTRRINAHVLEGSWRWRLLPSVDAGVAVGWTGFTDAREQSTGLTKFPLVSRFTATPVSIVVRPWQWFAPDYFLARAVAIRFNEAILFGSISSVDFAGAPGAFSRGTEANARVAVTFDYAIASIH
jgi:hypothetical protein